MGGKAWLNASQRTEIDGLFARPTGAPGYAVGVIRDDGFAFAKGYGLANLDDGIPITPDTSFHLASVSKQFTAAATALLILDRKISLSDPVARYIPETAKYGEGLRIEHLGYMTSGLHEYTDEPRKSGDPWATFYYFTRDEANRRSAPACSVGLCPRNAMGVREYQLHAFDQNCRGGQP